MSPCTTSPKLFGSGIGLVFLRFLSSVETSPRLTPGSLSISGKDNVGCAHYLNAGISVSALWNPTHCRKMSGVKDTILGTVDETLSTGSTSGVSLDFCIKAVGDEVKVEACDGFVIVWKAR